MNKGFRISENTRIPGTNILLEEGDWILVKEGKKIREATKAGLQCSSVQSIMTPRFRNDAHMKYKGLTARPCPEELENIVMASGFYKNGDGYSKTQGTKNWNLSYLGQGRDFRLTLEGSGGPKEDYIVILR